MKDKFQVVVQMFEGVCRWSENRIFYLRCKPKGHLPSGGCPIGAALWGEGELVVDGWGEVRYNKYLPTTTIWSRMLCVK